MKYLVILFAMSFAVTASALAAEEKVVLDCDYGALTVVEAKTPQGDMYHLVLVHDGGIVKYIRSQGIQGGQILPDGSLMFSHMSHWGWPNELKARAYWMEYRLSQTMGGGYNLSLIEYNSGMYWYFATCHGSP